MDSNTSLGSSLTDILNSRTYKRVTLIRVMVKRMSGKAEGKRFPFHHILTKGFLTNQYWGEKKSVRKIAKEVGCSRRNIRNHMDKLDVPTRNQVDAIRLKSAKLIDKEKLIELYCKKKFGTPTIANKLNCSYTTVWRYLKRYGIDRRDHTKAYHYQCEHFGPPMLGKRHSEATKERIRQARMEQKIPTALTEPEKKMKHICKKYGFPLVYTGDGGFWISGLNPDFVDENNHIIVEVFGRFWHTPNDVVDLQYFNTYDGRIDIFGRHDWKTLIFWEDEVTEERVVERLGELYD